MPPDYIDPMFHSRIIGAKAQISTLFFFDEARSGICLRRTPRAARHHRGRMGLSDGLRPGLGDCARRPAQRPPHDIVVNARRGAVRAGRGAGFLQFQPQRDPRRHPQRLHGHELCAAGQRAQRVSASKPAAICRACRHARSKAATSASSRLRRWRTCAKSCSASPPRRKRASIWTCFCVWQTKRRPLYCLPAAAAGTGRVRPHRRGARPGVLLLL